MNNDMRGLEVVAAKGRLLGLDMVYHCASGHLGGSFSAMDILTVLYFDVMRVDPKDPKDPDRDRFVLSKGHCTPALYPILAQRGYFPEEELQMFRSVEGHMSGHAEMHHVKGVDMSTGSLGQGISAAVGMALAGKLDKKDYRVYSLLGDGEIEEGQVWEAFMAAAKYKLDNLCAVIDVYPQVNRLVLGETQLVVNQEPSLPDTPYNADPWVRSAVKGAALGVVLALALPQLMGNAVKQTLEGGSLRFQFNWVNNSGGYGFKDFYFWFWVKNAGLPFILVVCACLCARRRGYLDIMLGMTAIYVVAETILFQPNEYDNNKLFYIWFMFAMILAADYGSMLMQRLAGLPGRALLCGLFLWASVFSGALSLGREAVSGYQLFSANAVAAGDWIRENTDRDDVFLTGQQHINPVCSLAGRQIICGSDLYVFFHGLDYSQQSADCRRFYEDPRENADVLETYNVHYIYVSDYERAEFDVDLYALDEAYELIYANDDVRIYDAGWRERHRDGAIFTILAGAGLQNLRRADDGQADEKGQPARDASGCGRV